MISSASAVGLLLYGFRTARGVISPAAMPHPHVNRWLAPIVGLAALAAVYRAEAVPQPSASKSPLGALELSIQKARLDNGLRVVMNVDRSSPSVALCVTYDVGSRNEEPGRSGFAHLFEHMMFQGSKNVEKGEHFTLLTARGATLNGTTSKDRTNYFEVLPANELALGLWLEADRMKWLSVTPENLENQRAVVQEEYRMRVSNRAYAQGYTRLNELVFEGYFPYAHDTIGSMEDLDAAKFAWVKDFHERFYAPNNAVLTIVGDFDPDAAMSLVREYFSDAKAQPNIPQVPTATLPEQTQERVAEVVDANARTKGVYYGYAIPPTREPAHYALELAAVILGDGESSRLHQRLVRKESKARTVSVWTNDHRGPDLFGVHAQLVEGATFEQIDTSIEDEIRRLAKTGPTETELEKAKNRVVSSFLFGIESNIERAIRLSNYEVFYGDARLLSREANFYLGVQRDEIRDAAKQYLDKKRRSVVKIRPTADGIAQKGAP